MTFLRGSLNYVWCTTSVLGKGATGAVYQGVNKHNGEPVAVKTFNQLSHMRPHEVQMREFDVLRKVNHKNIVKLLAIEEEQEGRGKVIVMELCTGGSLFNMLDDPENAFGLEEHEFFLVVRHLSDGMEHLRNQNLVHRDLKPGNIMKYIDTDGSTVYKLTDFGAARELDDDQQFMSLYGTEEYLHPDMYERAVLRKSAGKTFRATVDLWSIGVTLYHVSTGHLPFRPYGGRKNKETMHVITTRKKPGIISGIQTSEGGEIEWSRELPATCQLSLGARKLVTPLLAGLLEVDPHVMWTFERFFDQVTSMTSRLVLPVFYVNQGAHLKLYLQNDDSYEAVQRAINEQTSIEPANQILLWSDRQLLQCVAMTTSVGQYPASITPDQPIILFDKHNNDVTIIRPPPRPKLPTIPQSLSVENDAVLAKLTCSVSHEYRRRVVVAARARSLLDSSVLQLTSVLNSELSRINTRLQACRKLSSSVSRQVSLLSTLCCVVTRCYVTDTDDVIHQLTSQLNSLSAMYNEVSDLQRDLTESSLAELDRGVSDRSCDLADDPGGGEVTLLQHWRSRASHLAALNTSAACAATYTAKIRDSWQHLLRDRSSRNLTYNDEQFHHLEKIKLIETGRCLYRLLDSDVTPVCHTAAELLSDWYKIAQTRYIKKDIADIDVARLEQLIEHLACRLDATHSAFENVLQHKSPLSSTSQTPAVVATNVSSAETRHPAVSLTSQLSMDKLQHLEQAMASVWSELQENESLCGQLEKLTSRLVQS